MRIIPLAFVIVFLGVMNEAYAVCVDGTIGRCTIGGKPGTRECFNGQFGPCEEHEPPTPARIKELRQPPAANNTAIVGQFSKEWDLKPVAVSPGAARASPEDADDEEGEEGEALGELPVIIGDLGPGKFVEFKLNVARPSGLSASVRWAGSNQPLDVRLSQKGTTLATGKPYALGQNRGGATLSARAQQAGVAILSIKNPTAAPVSLRVVIGVNDGSAR